MKLSIKNKRGFMIPPGNWHLVYDSYDEYVKEEVTGTCSLSSSEKEVIKE